MLLFLLACTPTSSPPKDDDPVVVDTSADGDSDGYGPDSDCDDANADVHPGATELCNGLDDDCDAETDEAGAIGGSTWYTDADADGFGDPGSPVAGCTQPAGTALDATDCDDARADVSPDGVEVCDEAGADEDCDGLVNDQDSATGGAVWYADADGDGSGDGASAVTACAAPPGYVSAAGDCDDGDARRAPDAQEVCDDGRVDEDCDGLADDDDPTVDPDGRQAWYQDVDGDGFAGRTGSVSACHAPDGYLAATTDCNDADPDVSPVADEVCDGMDDDCDGLVDDDDPSIADPARPVWYADADGDGFGDPAVTAARCEALAGWVASADDCDDTAAMVHPGAEEDCATAWDDDCDGSVDAVDAPHCTLSYLDPDGDGWGGEAVCTCVPPDGAVATLDDCDEADPDIHPEAPEVCDALDQDCDGAVDEGLAAYVPDADADGFGASDVVPRCGVAGVLDTTDCNDRLAAVNPAASEWCNGIDDDCDALVDAADPSVDGLDWYADADADGYGDATVVASACAQPLGYVADATDCDDTISTVHPGGIEVYRNGLDDDCDGIERPDACADIYDQETLPVFDLTLADRDVTALRNDCLAGRQSYHPAQFTYDGETVSAAVRLKGNWSWNCDKYQFIVSFNESDPDGRFHGLRKIVLDSPWYDRTLLHERLAFPVYHRLDLPYSCANNARVNINGTYYGLYANVERIDHEYLERNFEDPEGNLYQGGSELKTNEDVADTRDIDAYHAASTVEQIEAVVDLDEATSEWAAEAILPAIDNYWAGVEINYYLYHYPNGRFIYLPYDQDITFGDAAWTDGSLLAPDAVNDDLITYQHTGWLKEELVKTVLADEAWCNIFVEKVAEARVAYDPELMISQIYEWDDQIADSYDEDPHHVTDIAGHEASVALLVSFVQDRADFVDAWLATGGHCPAVW